MKFDDVAIVAGLGLNGLGIVRALSHAGAPVVALDPDLGQPTAATRFGTKIRVAALAGPTFIETLLHIRARFATNPVLFLTQEASVDTVSAVRDKIAEAYRFSMPNNTSMQILLDKLALQALLERFELPVPRAARVNALEGIDGVEALRFPCVLKPAVKSTAYSARFAKAYRVADREAVRLLWSEMQGTVDGVIVQEWIEGDDSDIYFCLQYRAPGGGRNVSFVGRKMCQWPPLIGGTASCIPAPEHQEELTALTDRFFHHFGFIGLGSVEYKRDRRDGLFYFVEPTVGRSDYQEEIAFLNGVNIPLAAYLGELGLELPTETISRRPHGWKDGVGHAKAQMTGTPDPTRTLAPNVKIYDAYFRLDDPGPYFALKAQSLWQRLTRGAQ